MNPAFNELVEDEVVSYHGTRFVVGPTIGLGSSLIARFVEPEVFRQMEKEEGVVFIDVGANVGAYSLLLASRFKKVIAVEPSPVAARFLSMNLLLNNIHNVEIVQKAAFSRKTILQLYHAPKLVNWNLYDKSDNYDEVKTTTIDEICTDVDRVDLAKVDVEGAELEVIRGSRATLRKITKLIIEVRRRYEEDIIGILKAEGFNAYCIEDRNTEKNILAIKPAQ